MKKILFYLPKILSSLIFLFFAMFVLEGFSPEFGRQDSLMHGLLALAFLVITFISWRWPRLGGWLFVVIGSFFVFQFIGFGGIGALIIGGVVLATGTLFLAQARSSKVNK
jgi:hypothetical protein